MNLFTNIEEANNYIGIGYAGVDKIESAWGDAKNVIDGRKRTPCTKQAVLEYLFYSPKIWTWSWELHDQVVPRTGQKLSHRACARASDLAIQMPTFVECRKYKGYAAYRVKREKSVEILRYIKEHRRYD